MAELRVAILIPGHKIFGQERALLNLAECLRQRKIWVTILLHSVFGKGDLVEEIRERGFPFHFVPMNTIWSFSLFARNPLVLLRNLKKVREASRYAANIFAREGIDAFITGNWAFAAYVLPALRESDIAFVYRHGDEPPNSNPLVRYLGKQIFRRVDVHVANCVFLRGRLQAFCQVGKVRIVRNSALGVTRLESEGSVADARHLVYAGQLSQHKGVLVLLDAFDIVASEFADARMTLAGAYPGVGRDVDRRISQRLERAKAAWGERISYLGHVANVPDLFTVDSIHVCPSTWDEPSPNVIPEAKARRVPTVAFARGGIPEIVRSGVDGEIVESETAEALAKALTKLMTSRAVYAAQKSAAFASLKLLPDEDQLVNDWVKAVSDAIAIREQKKRQPKAARDE